MLSIVSVVVVSALGATAVVVVAVASAVVVTRRLRTSVAEPDVALAADLLAAALRAGATLPAALAAAASAAPDDVAVAFNTVADALLSGDDVATAWQHAPRTDGALVDVARACGRGATSGAAVADELARVAARARARRIADRQRRVQRASVLIVLPVGLCLLPAFVLVGVVPLVLAALPSMHS